MARFFHDDLVFAAASRLSDLEARGLTLVTAESCTGGLLAGLLTEIGGASKVFERGFVTYSNAAKSELLGVDPGLVAQFGAVSSEVAAAMAEGALLHSPADVALAITGIAGPDGGSAAKPVGLVFISVRRRGGAQTIVKAYQFGPTGRSQVRLASVHEALLLLAAVMGAGAH